MSPEAIHQVGTIVVNTGSSTAPFNIPHDHAKFAEHAELLVERQNAFRSNRPAVRFGANCRTVYRPTDLTKIYPGSLEDDVRIQLPAAEDFPAGICVVAIGDTATGIDG
nr:hypothetical protein [Halomonas stevensii]